MIEIGRTLIASCFLLFSAGAIAQTFPDKRIELVVPLVAGGATDNVARVLGERMNREIGQPVVIVNRPGANGRIGTEAVVNAPPDGYTLLVGGIGPLTIHPHLFKLPFDPVKGLIPIRQLTSNEIVIIVNPALPVKTPTELIAYLKANPGKNYGTSGTGGVMHLTMEMLRARIGFDATQIPFKGDADEAMAVASGVVDMGVAAVSTVVPLLSAGKVRAVAMTGNKRSVVLPDIPTFDESGIAGFNNDFWLGLFAPAKTPPAVIKKLTEVVDIALRDPALRKTFIEGGNNIATRSGDEFAAFLAGEYQKWGEVIRAGNIKLTD